MKFLFSICALTSFLFSSFADKQSNHNYRLEKVFDLGFLENASGMTFSHKSKTLFVINNAPEIIVEMTREGKVLRKISLEGFSDTEGICYLSEDLFAVVEERRGIISLIHLPEGLTRISKSQVISTWEIEQSAEFYKNKGLEGICYDAKNNLLYCVQEKKPLRLFTLQLQGNQIVGQAEQKQIKLAEQMNDASGLFFSAGKLMVLSHESASLSRYDDQGKFVDKLLLRRGMNEIDTEVEQAEGVCLDDRGDLFICSEPGRFFHFRKAKTH